MGLVHVAIGWSIVGGFGMLMLWGLVTWIVRRGPGKAFWWVLTFIQVMLIAQLIGGVILLLLGGRRPLLHYVYGVVFPVLVLIVAHVVARDAWAARPWAAFAVAAFFAFGLTLRALMTGYGIG
jgi:hypothetical protein